MNENIRYVVVYVYKPDAKSMVTSTHRMGPFEDRRQAEACIVQLASRAAVVSVSIEEESPAK